MAVWPDLGGWQAVQRSPQVSFRSLAVSLLPAIPAAWLLVRGRSPERMLLDAQFHLPPAVPRVVLGQALLMLVDLRGPMRLPGRG
jgi:ABC-type sulfate transport system permease component